MNILQINKFYYEQGGTERYFFALKKLLEENGHSVIPFAMQSDKNLKSKYSKYFVSKIQTQPSLNVWQDLRTVFRFWWSKEAQRKIQKLINTEKIDIAHIHNIYHQISPSILSVLKKNKIPVVMTVHDYSLISKNYNLYQSKKTNKNFVQYVILKIEDLIRTVEMFWHHKILKVYKKNIDVFIAPSEFVKKKLIQGGFDKKKIKIIPHFVSTNPSVLRKAQDTSPSQGEDNSKYILYFGRLSEEKGIQILIQAMQDLPDIKLKIAGQGYYKKKLETRNKKLGNKNVEFLGFKNQKELQKIILDSQFVVMPSIAPEVFGLSALEAMALGKCVIASRTGALAELIEENLLFESGNVKELVKKIKFLTKNENYAKIRGQENEKLVKSKYGKKEHFKRIFNVYSKFTRKLNKHS